MKFLRFTMAKVADISKLTQASDKTMASPPQGYKVLSVDACMGLAFPGQPEDTIVSIATIEADSAEVLAATGYPLMLAGATVWTVPVMEMPVAKTAEVEKKLRG
jgi:hypothetical protein